MNDQSLNQGIILGQKYAYATAALLVGIISYVQLLGIERAVLAIIFAWLALRSNPQPKLQARRLWAVAGLVLGAIMIIIVSAILIFKFDTFKELILNLEKLQ